MTIVPDLPYLESTHFDPFKENSYLERDKTLSGHVFYNDNDMEGRFVNGWRYEDGKAYAITPTDAEDVGFQLRGGCLVESIYYEESRCSPFVTSESGMITGIGISCGYYGRYFEYENCDNDLGGGGSGDYSGGSGNGSVGGGNGNTGNSNTPNVPGVRTDCPPNAAANGTTINNVLNSTTGDDAQVKSNIDLLRNYAKNRLNEYCLSVDKINNQILC